MTDMTGVNLSELLALPDEKLRPTLESMLPADDPIPGRRDILETLEDYAAAPEGTVAAADGSTIVCTKTWEDTWQKRSFRSELYTDAEMSSATLRVLRWGYGEDASGPGPSGLPKKRNDSEQSPFGPFGGAHISTNGKVNIGLDERFEEYEIADARRLALTLLTVANDAEEQAK